MTEDRTAPSCEARSPEIGDNGRDARGRWKTGHCPNPKGSPKKRRYEDYNPRDLRDFMNTQIEIATADGTQNMDRRTAFMNKLFEGAMKGKTGQNRLQWNSTAKIRLCGGETVRKAFNIIVLSYCIWWRKLFWVLQLVQQKVQQKVVKMVVQRNSADANHGLACTALSMLGSIPAFQLSRS